MTDLKLTKKLSPDDHLYCRLRSSGSLAKSIAHPARFVAGGSGACRSYPCE